MSLRQRLGFGTEPLYVMDGTAFTYRGFYAFQNMARSDGFPTNALYIVARIVLRLIREERPRYFAFLIDGKGPTYRNEIYPEYKANRSTTPEPLVRQLEPIHRMLDAFGLPYMVSQGCEADDCLASLAGRYRDERPVVIIGSDKDFKQCLYKDVVLWDPSLKEEKLVTLAGFQEETGMEPSSWPDYQALVGDSSDNIPGIPKIGPKTALELITAFPTLEDLFGRLAAVPPKIRAKLEGREKEAMLYRELTRLRTDACPEMTLEKMRVAEPDPDAALRFMEEFELRTLAREFESMIRAGAFTPRPVGAGRGKKAGVTAREKDAKAAAEAGKDAAPHGREQKKETGESAAAEGAAGQPKQDVKRGAEQTVEQGLKQAPGQIMGHVMGRVMGQAMEQGSLLAPAPAGTDFQTVATSADLPAPQGDVALVDAEAGLIVASAQWERLFAGQDADLAAWLAAWLGAGSAGKSRLAVPDAKALLKSRPPLRGVPCTRFFDLGIAAYLLSPEDRSYAWPALSARWTALTPFQGDPAVNPGLAALSLMDFFRDHLAGGNLTSVFEHLEMPLVPVLLNMEERGIAVDKAVFAKFLEEVQADLDGLTERIYAAAGQTFNIRSSQQLSDLLFVKLGLPKSSKTRGGAMSTSQEALEKLHGKHPVIDLILEYRTLEKLRSTYLEPLPKLADAKGRVHTTFNQTATATGRLSSSGPNLQNIPIRGKFGPRMRSCFVAAKGMELVSADYSQIELRVLAHLSQDPTLLDAFGKNEDIHSRTAGLLFDVPVAEVTPDQRRNAKTINFGLIYGMGAQKLARELGVSMNEAKEFMARYFERLGGLKRYYEQVEEDAKLKGYVTTMTGRRRLTPEILSENNQLRSQARRQAINTCIQGSAADIIKLAMIACENDAELKSLDSRLLLQIHDELVLETPAGNGKKAGERLAAIMSGIRPGGEKLSVPLMVDWGVGHNWNEAH